MERHLSCRIGPQELNERAEATDRSTPMGRLSFLFVRGVDLGFVLILGKSLFVLGLFFLVRSLHGFLHTSHALPTPECMSSSARAEPIRYEDCSPVERFSQCCLL